MKPKRHILMMVFLSGLIMFSLPLMAAPVISGDAGFELGAIFSPGDYKAERMLVDSEEVFKVIPEKNAGNVAYVLLRITKSNRIHRITVYSGEMSPVDCGNRQIEIRKRIETKHPTLGYYAMDTDDMFYQEPRTLVVGCVASGDKRRLRTEYADDELAKVK